MGMEKVPPDGGYGWVIVFANALDNFIVVPLMQSFGLIFKDTFIAMGLSATEGGFIINLNIAFGMIMGVVNGVLLKVIGYRKCAFLASSFTTIGLILTSYSSTFTQFIISYGLISSFGFGLNVGAHSFALNCYFRKNRSKAVGYAMTLTGLGPVVMPQIINLLMNSYSRQDVTLILGAISAHCFIAASFLHPLKWHLKTVEIEEEVLEDTDKASRRLSNASIEEIDNSTVYGIDSNITGSMATLPTFRRPSTVSHISSLNPRDSVYNPNLSKPKKKLSMLQRLTQRAVNFFDLDLLKDPIYVNILIGMSVAVFAELNFSVLTAFILAEFGLVTDQIATFLSTLGITDIIFRFFAPYIAQALKLTPRYMYMCTLFLLMLTRFCLLFSTNYHILLVVAAGLGTAKGIRTVYMVLVLPSYVPLEKLPSATGLQLMLNGFFVLIGGAFIGLIRDISGSYTPCIFVMNAMTFLTVLIWTIEIIVVRYQNRQK